MEFVKAACFVILLGTVAYAHVSLKDQLDWLSWKVKYNKNYENKESEIIHRQIWEQHKAFVEAHNQRKDVHFKMGLYQFADQDIQKRPILHNANKLQTADNTKSNSKLLFQPASWDWRKKGAVTPVTDQGQLGDVQAIVTAECVESFHVIHDKELLGLSATEAHDCCTPTGVLNLDVFQCVHNIGGLCDSRAYIHTPEGKCRNDSCLAEAQVDGGKMVTNGDENKLLEAVYTTPVCAAIDAGHASFQHYRSGVYSDASCSSTQLDHVVQIVGYGSQNGHDYWICKNSWGINWGMQGYILIARNKNNMCGIASMAVYPV